jgi:hypothetical protein
MAQTVLIKRSTTTNVPSSLDNGELAYSSSSNKLFIGRPGGAAGDVDAIGGKYYTDFIESLDTTGTGSLSGDVTGTLNYDIVNGTITGSTSIASQTYSADTGSVSFHVPSSSLTVSGDTNAIDTTITETGGAVTLTIDHKDLLTAGTAGESYGSTTAIPVLTVNAQGHVTSINETSISTTLTIKDDGNDTSNVELATDTLKFAGGTYITSDITATGTEDTITFSHDATTRTDTNDASSPGNGGSFDVIDSITTNTEGHVTAVNVKQITLPAEYVEADTLDSVTSRGNSTTNNISIGNLELGNGVDNTNNEGEATITGPGTITIDPSTTGAGGTLVVQGDLTVTGTTTTINSTTLELGDNTLVLNSTYERSDGDAAPTANAGLEVNRGGNAEYADVSLRWNETDDIWQVSVPVVGDQTAVTYSNVLTQANYETQIPTIDGGIF